VDLNWPFAGFDGTLDDVRAAHEEEFFFKKNQALIAQL
jgi:hypothetical protein